MFDCRKSKKGKERRTDQPIKFPTNHGDPWLFALTIIFDILLFHLPEIQFIFHPAPYCHPALICKITCIIFNLRSGMEKEIRHRLRWDMTQNTRLIAATQNPQNNNQLMNQSYHDKNAAGKSFLATTRSANPIYSCFCHHSRNCISCLLPFGLFSHL